MLACTNVISCNSSSLPIKSPKPIVSIQTQNPKPKFRFLRSLPQTTSKSMVFLKSPIMRFQRSSCQICRSTLNTQNSDKDPVLEGEADEKEGRDWTTSILLFVLWGSVLYYVFNLAPNQTPSIDLYFLKKLLYLNGDDGFRMNQVLVSLWYIMGLWPLVYSMLLVPTGRSSQSKIAVWPFLILSFFGGAYALLPYFVLWRPPPPCVEDRELKQWPLNFLDSKLMAGISLAAGVGLFLYAGLATGDWNEFYLYLKSSRFIHIMSLDFTLLSAFAPFWVYNDMTARKWDDKGTWVLPLSLVPFLGPALYLVLRPSLSERPDSLRPLSSKQD
ncbi:hypothetical protein HS088_TW22G00213 [Tripterygium wilfordii]|uniref:Transmembrane protein n=1 Tax=Tripterygium wilfordii TaxID=458696 RepID=A0A7J7BXW1_TRIWF|nr:uncharacterized protein LOC119990676 [Tripterygium wilfordii]KAF5726535.1 hypothetical protein HS088_TW22G00213 [Tripterygium wilfordii]